MSQGPDSGTDEDAQRSYAVIVTECLGDRAAQLRLADVVSATPRSVTLRLESEDTTRSFAFKFVGQPPVEPTDLLTDTAPSLFYPRAMIENEAEMLAQLQAFTDTLLVEAGRSEDRSWVMTRWLAGPSAARLARQWRSHLNGGEGERRADEARRELLALICAVFEKVAALHEIGYVHGDLQPAHFVYEDALTTTESAPRLALIDFGLARSLDHPGLPYRGALVHFTAPEVAAALRTGAEDIPYDARTEIYSAASVAFHLYTGQTSTDYGNPNEQRSYDDTLARIASGESRRTFATASAPAFPELEEILEECLSLDRASRCLSLRTVVDRLQHLHV